MNATRLSHAPQRVAPAKVQVLLPAESGLTQFIDDVLRSVREMLFRRAGRVVEPGPRATLDEVNADRLRVICERRCEFYRAGKQGPPMGVAILPRDLAVVLLAAAKDHPAIREIRAVVEVPCLLPDGALARPGYNPGGYFLVETIWSASDIEQMTMMAKRLAESPSAVYRLLTREWLRDFPFQKEIDSQGKSHRASRDNFVGLCLTAFLRPMIAGQTPFFLAQASRARTGKSLLLRVFGWLVYGRPAPGQVYADDEAEMLKTITAALRAGSPCINFDNIDKEIASTVLTMLLTQPRFTSRILGRSEMIDVDHQTVVVGTSNRAVLSGEMNGRTVPITLRPRDARPELRTRFRIPKVEEYTQNRRVILLAAFYAMYLRWQDMERRPKCEGTMGSFEPWYETVGSILCAAGFTGFMYGFAAQSATSEEEDQLTCFFEDLLTAMGGASAVALLPVTVTFAEIRKAAEPNSLFSDCCSWDEKKTNTALGRRIVRLLATAQGARPVEACGATWCLEKKGRVYVLRTY